jgi:hypothetical protein
MKAISLLLLGSAAISHTAPIYQLHEWGTFTTVSGSDGVLLSGLEREEEHLPPFVHSHFGLENGQPEDPTEIERIYKLHGTIGFSRPNMKGMDSRPLAHVNVKMETPVIYFHSNEAFHAKVKVGFDGGTISQWYPQRSGGETLPEPPPAADPKNQPTPRAAWLLDFAKPYHGAIEWDVEVLDPPQTRDLVLFKPTDNLSWTRTRLPVTNAVRTANGETEGYLFYRGIGHFDPGLRTTVDPSETLHLENHSGGHIPYLVVFEIIEGKLRWTEHRDGLDDMGRLDISEDALTAEPDGFSETLYRAVAAGLIKNGLTTAEARAMVETWWHSYFMTPGLRVFWVLPPSKTDQLLPLEASPAPSELVRVLVGRSEILRPRQEQQWQKLAMMTGDKANPWVNLVNADRFGLAIKERIATLSQQPVNSSLDDEP